MSPSGFNRRRFLASSLAAGLSIAGAGSAAAMGLSPTLFERARDELSRLGSSIPHRDFVGVCDFSAASRTPRFHLLHMDDGRISTFLVAHGRGSDPAHQGWVERLSNEVGSNASSAGAYRTGDHYAGRHGRSMRLDGLDASNNNAEARAIVVHGAWYVSPNMVRDHGKLGRSEGCFAFSESDLTEVLEKLKPGRLLLAEKFRDRA